MNTPFHMLVNTVILGKKARPKLLLWAMFGGLLPDLFLFINMAIGGIFGRNEFLVLKDTLNSMSHSIPLYVFLGLIAWQQKWNTLKIVCASALLHIAFDIPVHVTDARVHLWPFSDATWSSPVSFWDARYYGEIVGTVEGFAFILLLPVAWCISKNKKYRGVLIFISLIYAFTFWHFLGHMGWVPGIH